MRKESLLTCGPRRCRTSGVISTLTAAVILLGLWGCAPSDISVVRNEQPAATIVVPDSPLAACDKTGRSTLTQLTAAEELQTYLAMASGATLPIVPASQAPAKGPLILVGRSRLSDAYELALPEKPEGLRIVSFPRGIAILGEIADANRPENNTKEDLDRGIMHAVYTFLENYVGVRFYLAAPGNEHLGTVIPKTSTISLTRPIDYTDAPVFTKRLSGHVSLPVTKGGNADRCAVGHTHGRGWEKRYYDDHPEYFMLNADGSRSRRFLCYSEPGVAEAELRHIEEWYTSGENYMFSTRPTQQYIPVWPDDLYPAGGCACERCQAKRKAGYDGKWSNMWWDYIRRVAEGVAERYPNKRVVSGAYTTWLHPPDFPLPDNVCVQLCIHPPNYAHTYMNKQPEIYESNLGLVKAWSEKLGNDPSRLHLRQYGSNTHTGMPLLYPHVLQRWLRDIRPHCRGIYFDGIYGGGKTPQNYLSTWLHFRLLWNPDMDVDAAIQKHCREFFGPAGESMNAFYRLLIDRYEQPWPTKQVRAMPGHSFSITMLYNQTYPPEVLKQLQDSLHAASRKAGLPADPDWTVRTNSAWTLRNAGTARKTYTIALAPVDSTIRQPALRWKDGEITYHGTLQTGQRILIQPGPTATLFEKDGSTRDVTSQAKGTLPTLSPDDMTVIHYASRQSDPRDRLRIAMGDNADNPTPKGRNSFQRRLMWLRRFFEVHTMGWGRYSSPDGPLALGRMTQEWLERGSPEYNVAHTDIAPDPNPESECWQSTASINLIQGSPSPQNADLNVGFPADLPTKIKMMQDDDNLYVLFQCTQFVPPTNDKDSVVMRLWRGKTPVLEFAMRPDSTLYPAPPFKHWKSNYGLDTTGITGTPARWYPPSRTIKIPPASTVAVQRDTGDVVGSDRIYAGHMTNPLVPHQSYLRFDIPELADNEHVTRAVFHAYLSKYLNWHAPCGVRVSYSPEDEWNADTSSFTPLPPLTEPISATRDGEAEEEGRGWFAATISRYLQLNNEGPGKPLTLGITAAGYQGMRGFALSTNSEEGKEPYISLDVEKPSTDNSPWWSLMVTIPKEKIAGNDKIGTLSADFARTHGDKYYQWTPALAYIWTYSFPMQRLGHVRLD
ncbi:MAG: DUF4838 domain-containing protein [Candidatus Pacebacteria bacterium]|nr:DUF4838 domain-containing protein [Candidatus Paceibacterota bacterium]